MVYLIRLISTFAFLLVASSTFATEAQKKSKIRGVMMTVDNAFFDEIDGPGLRRLEADFDSLELTVTDSGLSGGVNHLVFKCSDNSLKCSFVKKGFSTTLTYGVG